MGCEFCQNGNRENIEFKLAGQQKRPIDLKNKFNEYYSTLEDRLNEKYSIPQEILDELKEKKMEMNTIANQQKDGLSNKNKEEYIFKTSNKSANNEIELDSKMKKKNEENKENDINKNLEEDGNGKENSFDRDSDYNKQNLKNEEIIELKNNLKNKNDKKRDKSKNIKKNKILDFQESSLSGDGDYKLEKIDNKKKNKDKSKHSYNHNKNHKDKHKNKTHSKKKKRKKSENEEEENNSEKNNDEEKEDKIKNNKMPENKDKNYNIDNSEENNFDNKSEINDSNNSEKKENKKEKLKKLNTEQIHAGNVEKIISLLKEIKYSNIDKILKDSPIRTKSTLEKLIKYFKKNSKKLSLVERAWLVYKWITENIEYDFKGVNNENYDISEEATFKRGKSICSGYARLYQRICVNLELKVERIGGYSKGFNYKLTTNIEESEKHEWNAVQIDNEWFFIESTWGAGYSTDDKIFIKRFNGYFFFTPPNEFIRGHFPFDSKWQLLPNNKIINEITFMEFVHLKSDFFIMGFNSIEPDYTFNDVEEKGKFNLLFDKNKAINYKKIKIMAKLYLMENKTNNKEIKNSILEKRKEDYYEINYLINKKGKYQLKIFGNNDSNKEYNELCTLILESKKDITIPNSYPLTTGLYYKSDIEIIQPINGPLKEGDKITFELKTLKYDELYIGINTGESTNFIEMSKENNIFKEEDLLIFGKKIYISCKAEKENNYSPILEYVVSPISKKKNAITFPKTFAGPKNRLIEPFCDTLKKGKTVNFIIKSELIEEMLVVDGEEMHNLNKKNDIFSGSIKITGKGEVKIVFKKEDGGYGVLYLYKVI